MPPDVPPAAAGPCPAGRFLVSPAVLEHAFPLRGHAPGYVLGTCTGDTRSCEGTVQVLPPMHDEALVRLCSGLGPDQLQRLAAFGGHHGALLIAPPAGQAVPALTFTLAVAAAMRLLPLGTPEP